MVLTPDQKAVVAVAKDLRKSKLPHGCKACLGHATTIDFTQPAPHAEAECLSAQCARCGRPEDHHDSACTSPTSTWPAFTEAEQASMEAGWNLSKGPAPSFWRVAKACTKAGREKRVGEATLALRSTPRNVPGTINTPNTTDGTSTTNQSAPVKTSDLKFFTKQYPKITINDEPKTHMEHAKDMIKGDQMNSIVGLRLDNESVLNVKSAKAVAVVQTIKDHLDLRGGAGSQNIHPLRTTQASATSIASRKKVLSNHYPLIINKGVKLHHYTVVLTSKPKIGKKRRVVVAAGNATADDNVEENAGINLEPAADVEPAPLPQGEEAGAAPGLIDQAIADLAAMQAVVAQDERRLANDAPAEPPNDVEIEGDVLPDALDDDPSEDTETSSGDSTKKASRPIKRMVVSEVLHQCPEFKTNTKNLATDFLDTVVSWMDLFPTTISLDPQSGKGIVWEGTVSLRPDSTDDKKTYGVRVIRQAVVDLDEFNAHIRGEGNVDAIRYNIEKVTKLLNIFVSRHVYQNAGYSEFEEDVAHSNQPVGKGKSKGKGKGKGKGKEKETSAYTFKHMGDKYFATNSESSLGDNGHFKGLFSALRGFTTKVVPGMGTAFLNINVCASAFFRPMSVADYLLQFWKIDPDMGKRLLRRVRVYIMLERKYNHLNVPGARIKTIQDFGEKSQIPDFTNNETGVSMPVEKHLFDEHKWERHADTHTANLPYVNVGGQQEGTKVWYPADKLWILPYQRLDDQLPTDLIPDMIRFACPKPGTNRHLLHVFAKEALMLAPKARLNPADPLDLTTPVEIIPGIKATVYMAEHPAGRVRRPDVLYDGQVQPEFLTKRAPDGGKIQGGKWNLANMQFHSISPDEIKIHAIVSGSFRGVRTTGFFNDTCPEHIEQLIAQLKARGMNVQDSWTYSIYQPNDLRPRWEDEINQAFTTATNNAANLVILMPEAKKMTSPSYAYFKRMADVEVGIKSTCITQQASDNKGRVDYMANVAMKINLKFPNDLKPSINHTVGRLSAHLEGTLVLGADVTHPGSNCVKGTPSIAALIGSTDKDGCHYTGSMRLQEPETDRESKEIITGSYMQGMAEECLESYFKRNNKLPDKIIFYRDGVSQGAYARFKMEEVTGVRNAYAAIVNDLQQPTLPVNRAHLAAFRKPELADEEFRTDGPLITAIVGEKRHHTRFFPTGVPVTSDENTPFGTFVEAGPTSPYYYDFFLQAHQAVAGTVKPTHYFVVVDENKISMDTLVTITNALSFVYQRATLPVSYAAPTYYADHLAERGRKYLKSFLDGRFFAICENYIDFSGVDPAKADGSAFADDDDLKEALRVFGDGRHGDARALVGDAARVAFREGGVKGLFPGCSRRGPWHERLDDTMFWL